MFGRMKRVLGVGAFGALQGMGSSNLDNVRMCAECLDDKIDVEDCPRCYCGICRDCQELHKNICPEE